MTIEAAHPGQEVHSERAAADGRCESGPTTVHARELRAGTMQTGLVVEFSNGHRNVVRKTLRGWMLISADGRQVVRPVPSPESFAMHIAAIEAYYADRGHSE